ncbi:MAG: DUF2905 domain-containing protein [candidate division WOR-3 bacterium]
MTNLGRIFILCGVIFVIVGSLFLFFPKIPIFRLPGDIVLKKGNFLFYFPLLSCILISVILSLLFNFIFRK